MHYLIRPECIQGFSEKRNSTFTSDKNFKSTYMPANYNKQTKDSLK